MTRIDTDRFMTATLRAAPWGGKAARIMAAALEAVDPERATLRHLHRQGKWLVVDGESINLDEIERVFVVGAGKAGAPMTRAVVTCLGEKHVHAGLVIIKEGYGRDTSDLIAKGVDFVEAGHPIPDKRGQDGTLRMMSLLEKTTQDDLVLCVISGGGSALMHALAQGISLEDMQRLTSLLLAVGADIQEINTLRKHLDQIKGGGLARAAAPAKVVTLILSDVIGDPLDVIASGPTVPNRSSVADAWAVLERYTLLDKVPPSIVDRLQGGLRGEPCGPAKHSHPIFERVSNVIVGNNQQAAEAGLLTAQELGYTTMLLTTKMQGEARHVGRALAALARQVQHGMQAQAFAQPACLVAGGETTVTLIGKGKGGRNQELALGAVEELAGLEGVGLIALATDGGDGPTDAAGAVVTGESLKRAENLGLLPGEALARNDAYPFFAALGDLLKPGPTQTNVNDLTFLLIGNFDH